MEKTILKSFATESRNNLIEDVIYRLNLIGITETKINDPISETEGIETFQIGNTTFNLYDKDIDKRKNLVNEINSRDFNSIVEEVAYTWFNRIIAIRFMEVNNYLPSKTRVLSSETENKIEPDIINDALDLDFDYSQEDKELIFNLKNENKLDDLFRFLFLKQCNKLNEILPNLFEKTNDYFDLLLNISFINENGIVRTLVDKIPEEYFKNVEVIGWLYQFYISEKKDSVNTSLKSKPIQKHDIPAATQLFTPDWIVKYMVDNSLGRYWIERNNDSSLKDKLQYLFEEPGQDEDVKTILNELRTSNINVENLKFFDSCMGSAHILVYAFDVFMEIYKELGYLEREIPELILNKNLFGLDIDKRAYQLAYFALMMKARKHDRKLFKKNISLNIYPIIDSNISETTLNYIKNHDLSLFNEISYLNELFNNASEFGSLLYVKNLDYDNIEEKIELLIESSSGTILDYTIINEIKNKISALINQAKVLALKYEAVVTNPPYLNKFDKQLKEFSKKNYKDYSKDLFSMFIYRNFDFCKEDGYTAFMTPMVWMFIKNYEKLRKFIIENKSIITLIELEYLALWEIEAYVPACTFVLSNQNFNSNYNGSYLKLTEYKGGLEVQNKKVLDSLQHNDDEINYFIKQNNFNKIPGSPIAYWIDDNFIECFSHKKLKDIVKSGSGIQTSDNKRFLRLWFEVSIQNSLINKTTKLTTNLDSFKWIPYNNGGFFRKWYGNQEAVINWENDGFELRNFKKSLLRNIDFNFKQMISWSKLSSGKIAFRYYPEGFIFGGASGSIEDNRNNIYLLGFLNSNIAQSFLDLISPTLNYESGHISSLPIIINENKKEQISNIVLENISICKNDWDDYETSWNFKKHPLLYYNLNLIESFKIWCDYKNKEYGKLKNNEYKLNKIFSEIYNLSIPDEIEDKYISISKANLETDIKSFISYAIGCMLGRYSLDNEGLQFAGGEFDISNYNKFIPDDDNIIPILDTAYFDDDIVGYFTKFVETCFGKETLEENLDFIAGALSKSNKSSREIIRQYLLKNFFNDHKKTYKKCPIYWQFSSGKQNGFNCLVYMHRYEPSLVARIRTDYLHKTQKAIEQRIINSDNIINNSTSKQEVANATKEKAKLQKQLKETQDYDEVLAHIANQNIEIDLDDGVKVNYAKFQNIEIKKEGSKTKKANLLKKI